jgi:hypothetical protein
MCRLGQEGGAPIGGGVSSTIDRPDAPDWKEANEHLMKALGSEVYATLRFSRRELSMHDAELIIQRLGKSSRGK